MAFFICKYSVDIVTDKLLPQSYLAIGIYIEKFCPVAMNDIYRHILVVFIMALWLSVSFRFFF